MDADANRSTEKHAFLVTQKRRKRADTEHAANSCRLKRHRLNQHLNSDAEAHVPVVHSDERVYQQDTSSSAPSLSPKNGRQLLVNPGEDNVASGSTRAHANDGSAKAGDLQGSGSLIQKFPVHLGHSPTSTPRRSPYCGQSLPGLRPATRSSGQRDRENFPSPPEDLEGEDPCGEEELDSVPGRQGRGVRKPPGLLLSPEQEEGSPSQEEGAAQAPAPAHARPLTRIQEGQSLNFDPKPVTPRPDFSKTCDSSTLHYRHPLANPCCDVTQDSRHDDSDDDDEVPIVRFGNLNFEDALQDRDLDGDTVTDRHAKPVPVAVIGSHSANDRPEDIDGEDGDTNGELGDSSQVGSDKSVAESVNDPDDADTESTEASRKDAINSHVLSQRLGATILEDPDPGEYTSDDNENNVSPSPVSERNTYPHSDTDTFDQDSSSGAVSFYESSDYEDSDLEDNEMNEEEEYLSDLCEVNNDSPDANTSNALTPSMTTSGRRRLTSEERELIRQTREIGACCLPNPRNPEGKCKTCKRFSKTSTKTIHRVPCLRLRITEIVLYRSGGLNLTKRWEGIEMRDVSNRQIMSSIVIQVSQDFCKKPISIEVVQFEPQEGDVTARYWTECHSGRTTRKKKELPTYCLKSIYATAKEVRRYTIENALPAYLHTIQEELSSGREGGPVVFRTYYMILTRYMELIKEHKSGNAMSPEDEKEAKIYGNLFILWCAMQHTVGSLYIQGDETLGIRPENQDKSYPLYGKISPPRMIVAQFDNLVYNAVLETYKEKVLKDVDWLFSQDKNRWWFTVYNILFIFLREVSRMTADRYRHARQNFGPKPRYSIPGFVERLHESCNNMLTHWHYYNCNKWPQSKDEDNTEHFANIAVDDLEIIKQTRKDKVIKRHLSVWKQYKTNNGKVNELVLGKDPDTVGYTGSQDKFDWDHPLYWVAQMFEKNWSPHPTYEREVVPKNPFPTPVSTPS
ncbi:unnamed protein product [Fusarium graminearum]|nr:unnamed protein product [Fusarium graminearum]